MGKKSKKPWYRNGLRFECTQCGACCTGEPGLVQFNRQEGREMAAELDMTEVEFLNRFARASDEEGLWELREAEIGAHGHDCVLLERCETSGQTWCRAHAARPLQCRTWPFWPDNLRNKRAWERAAQNCEGIGQGDLVPLRVIQNQKNCTPDWGRAP